MPERWRRVVTAEILLLSVSLLTFQATSVQGEESKGTVPDNTIKEVGPGAFQIGKVRLDKNERTVSVPAMVNMREGVVEYLLVTSNGKTHESVLRTEAEPYHIHLAILLLNAKGKGSNESPADKTKPTPGDPVKVAVICKGKEVPVPAEDLVFDRSAKTTMQRVDWIYNGSQINAEGFAAQQTGSIISLIDDPDALINNPLPLRSDEDNWLVAVK